MKMLNPDRAVLLLDRAAFTALCLMLAFTGMSNSGVEICFIIALIASLARDAIGRRWADIIPRTPLNTPLIILFAAAAISLFFCPDTAKGVRALFGKTAEYILIFFLMARNVNTKRRFHIIMTVFLFSAAIVAASGVYQLFAGHDFLRQRALNFATGTGVRRMTSAFHKRSGFGAYLTIALPLAFSLVLSLRAVKWKRALLAILVATLAYCMVSTYSRGAWVGVTAGLSLVGGYLICRIPKRAYRMIAVGAALAVICAGIVLMPAPVRDRVVSIGQPDEERLAIWRATGAMIADRPFFGHGINSFLDVYPSYRIAGKYKIYAHNGYLQMAAEIGLIGLAAFLWAVLSALFLLARSLMRSGTGTAGAAAGAGASGGGKLDPFLAGLLGGLSAFLIHSLFDNNLFSLQLAALFWSVLGLSAAGLQLKERRT